MDATAKILAEAFDIAPENPTPEWLSLALGEMGYVIKKAPKPRATAARKPVEVFAPNTGNPAVDAFMRRHHDPKYKPLPMPKGPSLPALRPMKVSEQDAAERAWRSACTEAAERVALGKPSDAEIELRTLIARHRNPWRRIAATSEMVAGKTGRREVFASERHPDIEIHAFSSSDPITSNTWRLQVDGEIQPRIHYAMQAAEQEADERLAAASA